MVLVGEASWNDDRLNVPEGLDRGNVQTLASALAHPCKKKQIENGDALRRNDQQVCLELRGDD